MALVACFQLDFYPCTTALCPGKVSEQQKLRRLKTRTHVSLMASPICPPSSFCKLLKLWALVGGNMAAICWYFNQLGGNSTCNKEELALIVALQPSPYHRLQLSGCAATTPPFMASSDRKKPHQTFVMSPLTLDACTDRVQRAHCPAAQQLQHVRSFMCV